MKVIVIVKANNNIYLTEDKTFDRKTLLVVFFSNISYSQMYYHNCFEVYYSNVPIF